MEIEDTPETNEGVERGYAPKWEATPVPPVTKPPSWKPNWKPDWKPKPTWKPNWKPTWKPHWKPTWKPKWEPNWKPNWQQKGYDTPVAMPQPPAWKPY